MTDIPCWVTEMPANAADSAWDRLIADTVRAAYAGSAKSRDSSPRNSLLNDRKQALDHLIGGGHYFSVGRVGLLRHDQLAELCGDIDIGRFQFATHDFSGRRIKRTSGFRCRRESLAVERLQRILTVECGKRNVSKGDSLAV